MRFIASILFITMSIQSIGYGAEKTKPLSEVLPVSVVRYLIDHNIWKDNYDSANDVEGKGLSDFWYLINKDSFSQSNINEGVDSLIGTMESEEIVSYLPQLYPAKIQILRYQKNKGEEFAIAIHNEWKRRYVNMAVALMRSSDISEFDSFGRDLLAKIDSKKVIFRDLDLSLREELAQSISKSHGVSVTTKDSRTGRYVVNGLFNKSQKLFAIDLSRSINETIITFAHESVHIADEELDEYRNKIDELYPEVIKVLSKWVGSQNRNVQVIARDLLNHVLYETSSLAIINHFREIRELKIEHLSEKIVKNADIFEHTEKEFELLQEFFSASLGLTLINEYKAYGLSLSLYLELKNRDKILPPSKERMEFIKQFLRGDEVMVVNLAQNYNPFNYYKSQEFAEFIRSTAEEDIQRYSNEVSQQQSFSGTEAEISQQEMIAEQRKQNALRSLRMMKSLQVMELAYMKAMENIIRGLNNRFKNLLSKLNDEGFDDGILAPFAKPGAFNSPLNPYQILNARLSTAWILRLRKNIHDIYACLRDMTNPVFNMRLGILDLSDITHGERQLIGIAYANEKDGAPANIDHALRADLNDVPQFIKDHFELVNWSFDPSTFDTNMITAADLEKNLFNLRLLKLLVWSENIFPIWKTSLMTTYNFIDLIDGRQYNTEDISYERAQELKTELQDALKASESARQEYELMSFLLLDIAKIYQIAEDYFEPSERQRELNEKRLSAQRKFHERRENIFRNLDKFAIYSQFDRDSYDELIEDNLDAFKKQLKPAIKQCRSLSRNKYRAYFWPTSTEIFRYRRKDVRLPNFEIRGQSFPLSIVCNQGNIYLLRQPGDSQRGLLTQTLRTSPDSNNSEFTVKIYVFNGGRPILMDPYDND